MRFLCASLVSQQLMCGQQRALSYKPTQVMLSMAATSPAAPAAIAKDQSWYLTGTPFLSQGVQDGIYKLAFEEDVVQGAKNIDNILAIPHQDILQQLWIIQDSASEARVAAWAPTLRGSDVFLKKMGNFDINKAYQSLVQKNIIKRRRKMLDLIGTTTDLKHLYDDYVKHIRENQDQFDTELKALSHQKQQTSGPNRNDMKDALIKCSSFDIDVFVCAYLRKHSNSNLSRTMINRTWLVDLSDLHFEGYFAQHLERQDEEQSQLTRKHLGIIMGAGENCPTRQHLVRYYDSWCHPNNFECLDAVANVAEQRKENNEYEWPADWEKRNPRQLLNKIEKMVEHKIGVPKNDRQYTDLRLLEDKGRIRVVRSDLELFKVSVALHNCAYTQHAGKAYQSEAIFVTLQKAQDPEKPVALGMMMYGHRTFCEVRVTCNKEAPSNIKQFFHDYESVIEKWKQYGR